MMEGNTNATLGRLDLPKGMTAYNLCILQKGASFNWQPERFLRLQNFSPKPAFSFQRKNTVN